ncbi:tyrosine-type recombinase/integrase [Oscillibacter sp.]|uniref:tyrosine-type recombinase/integrase n=1 Tax=Oscillibacter sp. TaxID=1945593 RepID=UPI0028A29CC8|nr:tyrosine-type recombinase/integrase [Oscillibacter sp.]
MPRRGENVYKRKDGRWEGRILKPDGKYRYVYAKTYKEVKDKQKNYKEHIRPREMKQPGPVESAVELFEHWLYGDITNHVKASTFGNYFSCVQHYVIPFFEKPGNECLTELSAARFTASINHYSTLSESYKRKILIVFKTALKEIVKGWPTCSAIMEAVKLPKTENTEVQVFSINEQRLIENAISHSEDIRAFGILLTFYTGIRLGELCALKWSDFDYEAGTMSVTKTVTRVKNMQGGKCKTKLLVGTPKSQRSMRKIPLPAFLLDMQKKYSDQCTGENCHLISGTSTPTDPRVYQKLYKKILKDACVKDRKFHAIRHTFATRALELGVDIKTLSEILGHASVSITLNIYAHSLMEQKKIAMDKFNELHITHMAIASIAVTASVVNI